MGLSRINFLTHFYKEISYILLYKRFYSSKISLKMVRLLSVNLLLRRTKRMCLTHLIVA